MSEVTARITSLESSL
jgi:hypothetical protein